MAALGRLFRLSAVSLAAAGGVLKLSKEMSSNTREGTPNSNLELVLVQIAFRHGARTPIFRPPCKELETVSWPADLLMGGLPHTAVDYELKHVSGGPSPVSENKDRVLKKLLKGGSPAGQLTKLGQQQMYELGKKRGKKYVDDLKFLQGTYNPQEIYIRTSNFQRTIDSARCVVAGMFGKNQVKGLTMYTEDEAKEFLYPNLTYCAVLKNWWKYSLSCEGVDFIEGFHDRQKKIGEALKMDYQNKSAVAIHLRDIVITMIAHNMEVPKAILGNFNVIEEQALELFLSIQCGLAHKRKEVLSLAIGVFLEYVMGNFIKTIDGELNYKMMLYSVHDTTMAPLLLVLGLFDNKWPEFAADLAFELYRDKKHDYYVRVLYKGEEKIIPKCASPFCRLNKFKELVSEYFIDNWEKECKVALTN